MEVFDITASGNFEGVNIPNLLKSSELELVFSYEKRNLNCFYLTLGEPI